MKHLSQIHESASVCSALLDKISSKLAAVESVTHTARHESSADSLARDNDRLKNEIKVWSERYRAAVRGRQLTPVFKPHVHLEIDDAKPARLVTRSVDIVDPAGYENLHVGQQVGGDQGRLRQTEKDDGKGPVVPKADKTKKKAKAATTAGGDAKQEANMFDRLLITVGRIVDVEKHPDADSLYVEKVDFGCTEPTTVVSGLVKHVPLHEMQGRIALFLRNLKPAKMRGITSEAMIMCASTPEKVEIIKPPTTSRIGDIVSLVPSASESSAESVAKLMSSLVNRKVFDQVAPDLTVDDCGVARYKDQLWYVRGDTCSAPTLRSVAIK